MKELLRCLRGGSWDLDPDALRTSLRDRNEHDTRDLSLGFRLVVRVKGEGMVDVRKG